MAAQMTEELNRPGIIRVVPETRPGARGERAMDVPLAGQLLLTFLSGGAATALINVLAAWLPRGGDTRVELELPDGRSITLKGPGMTPEKVGEFMEAVRKFEPPA